MLRGEEIGSFITFYSYKGGTGRTMILANLACLIANKNSNLEKLLIIDWDLEAPGINRYFNDSLNHDYKNKQSGLIDYFICIKNELKKQPSLYEEIKENDGLKNMKKHFPIEKYIINNVFTNVDLMLAGKDDENYPTKVANFNWAEFYNENGDVIDAFKNYISHKYKYCLIDSRTGYTDTSGICTMLLPEKIILVFTPNYQSLLGAIDLARTAVNYRLKSNDLRPLSIFPVPSRIDDAEEEMKNKWRKNYQEMFENLFKEIYDLEDCDLTEYFDEVKVPYKSYYSYGEKISVISERDESFSLHRAFKNISPIITTMVSPWDKIADGYDDPYYLLSKGSKLHKSGDYYESIKLLNQFIEIVDISIEEKDRQKALKILGDSYQKIGDDDRAIKSLRACLESSRKIGDNNTQIDAIIKIVEIYLLNNKIKEVDKTLRYSNSIFADKEEIPFKLIMLNGLGKLLQSHDKLKQAAHIFERSIKIATENGDKHALSTNLASLGEVYQYQGKFDHAVDMFKNSLQISVELGDMHIQANILNSLGEVYERQRKYDDAIELFKKSMTISKKLGEKQTQANTLNNLGIVYDRQRKFDKAAELFRQSMTLSEELGDKHSQAITLNSLGVLDKRQKKYNQAVDLFQQSKILFEELGDKNGLSIVLTNIGEVYQLQEKFTKAANMFRQSVALLEELGNKLAQAISMNKLGVALISAKKYEEALDALRYCVNIFEELGDKRSQAIISNSIGKLLLHNNEYNAAISIFQLCLDIFDELSDLRESAFVEINLADTYLQIAEYKTAMKHYEHSLEKFRVIGDKEMEKAIIEKLSNLSKLR